MELKNIPMCPSVNKIYATDFRTKRRFKSKDAIKFESDFSKWILTHEYQLGVIKTHLNTKEKHEIKIELEIEYYFPYSKIFCKNGKPKRLDHFNRSKMLIDQLSKAIGIDDCYIFKTTEEKLVDEKEYINLKVMIK